VLRPAGRLAISDIVLRRPLPEPILHLVGLWTGCVTGALLDADYQARLRAAGFGDVELESVRVFDHADVERLAGDLATHVDLPDGLDLEALIAAVDGAVTSAFVRARKPDSQR
jgi:arsenite methyltransferase